MKKHTARRKPTRYGKTLAIRFEKKKIKTNKSKQKFKFSITFTQNDTTVSVASTERLKSETINNNRRRRT